MKKYIAILLLAISGSVYAETTTYICDYPTWSNQEGNHKTESKFVLTFIVDRKADKSYLVGNNGSAEVVKFESSKQTSFLEVTGTRNITATTIDSSLNSVHSRSPVLSSTIIPSQHYGTCEIK